MTGQQIYQILKDEGFIPVMASTKDVIILTFKDRQITVFEVANVLNIDSKFCQRVGTSVIVYGVDA